MMARMVSDPLNTFTTAPIRNDPRARAEFGNASCRKLNTRSDNSNDVATTTKELGSKTRIRTSTELD